MRRDTHYIRMMCIGLIIEIMWLGGMASSLFAQIPPKPEDALFVKVIVWGDKIDKDGARILAYEVDEQSHRIENIQIKVKDKAMLDTIMRIALMQVPVTLEVVNGQVIGVRVEDDDSSSWAFGVQIEVHAFTQDESQIQAEAHPISRAPTIARARMIPRHNHSSQTQDVEIVLESNTSGMEVGRLKFAPYAPNSRVENLWKIAGQKWLKLTLPKNSEWVYFFVIPYFSQEDVTGLERQWGIRAKWNTNDGLTLTEPLVYVSPDETHVCQEIAIRDSCGSAKNLRRERQMFARTERNIRRNTRFCKSSRL